MFAVERGVPPDLLLLIEGYMGSLGWTEILVILVIALIVFGPRKLPELGKSLGQSLAQFRRASEDFKRTWEEEVEMEKRRLDSPAPSAESIDRGSDFNYDVPDSESGVRDENPALETAEITPATSDEEPRVNS